LCIELNLLNPTLELQLINIYCDDDDDDDDDGVSHREQNLLQQHILLMASLDQQMLLLAGHQRLLDVMVDTAADASSDHV